MGKYKGFTQVELRKPKRSMFDLSHESRVSSRMGRLTPIVCIETLPNDTFSVSSEVLIKLAPLIAPMFHRLNLYVHYFFVPNRLLWEDWETFITGGRLGEAISAPPVPPYQTILAILGEASGYLDTGSLADYLGFPSIPDSESVNYSSGQKVDFMPFAAYFKCYMDYYRDRNYVSDTLFPLPMASGAQAGAWDKPLELYQRSWQHDYFTSAQTETQRGPEVLMPLEGSGHLMQTNPPGGSVSAGNILVAGGLGQQVFTDDLGIPLQIDLDESDVSINDFRRAIALQQWMERNQLAGSRYSESIKAHFARTTSDGRLQRAEYLGGGKAVIKIDEVMTTSYSEDADTNVVPPANPSGSGSAYSTTNRFRYNCEEHGFVIGILSVMPSSGYMQGVPKMFMGRRTFLDYPFPSFANLGEQPVYDYEIFANPFTTAGGAGNDQFSIFGYQSRYAEWKAMESTAHGDFRTTLDYWHLTRKFASAPNLGASFVEFDDTEQDRVFNVSGVDTLWMYIYNQVRVVRSLPYFGVPAGLAPNSL